MIPILYIVRTFAVEMRKVLLLSLMITANSFAQGVMDVHSHLITPEFVSSLEKEGRLMDEGFPLPKYDVYNHLKWMDNPALRLPC